MVETQDVSSPLHGEFNAGLPLPAAAMSVRVVPGLRVLTLRHLARGTAAVAAAAAAHGLAPLPEPGAFCGTDPWLLWAGPAEFLLLTTSSAVADGVQQALAPGREALACVLDLSAGCLVLELTGHGVSDGLLHLLDASAVPRQAGQGTRTRLMDIPTVVLRLRADSILLVVDRAYGVYLSEWIKHALDAEPGTSFNAATTETA